MQLNWGAKSCKPPSPSSVHLHDHRSAALKEDYRNRHPPNAGQALGTALSPMSPWQGRGKGRRPVYQQAQPAPGEALAAELWVTARLSSREAAGAEKTTRNCRLGLGARDFFGWAPMKADFRARILQTRRLCPKSSCAPALSTSPLVINPGLILGWQKADSPSGSRG